MIGRIAIIKATGKRGFVVGFTTDPSGAIVSVTVRTPQGRLTMYLPKEVEVL